MGSFSYFLLFGFIFDSLVHLSYFFIIHVLHVSKFKQQNHQSVICQLFISFYFIIVFIYISSRLFTAGVLK